MKKLLILTFSILIVHSAFADQENNDNNQAANAKTTTLTTTQLPSDYQQFRYRLLNYHTGSSGIPSTNYNGGDDYTMLYVAGGIVIGTTSFILINGKNEYTGEFFGATNTGMLVGGIISSATLVTKYFIDKTK